MAFGKRIDETKTRTRTRRIKEKASATEPVTRNYRPRGVCIGAILKWDDGSLEDFDYEHIGEAVERIRRSTNRKDDIIVYFWFSKAAGDSATPQTEEALWERATAEGYSGTDLGDYVKTAYKKRFFKAGPDLVPLVDAAGKWIEVSAPDPDNSEGGVLQTAT